MNGIDAQIIGQYVVVGIAGLNNGLVHVNATMSAFFVIAEAIVAEHEVARVENRKLRRTLAQFERR